MLEGFEQAELEDPNPLAKHLKRHMLVNLRGDR
jgi:hypothetical protein